MVFHDYDPDVARRKLDAAGWVAGSDGVRTKDGKRLHIDIIAVNGAYASTLELLRVAWSAIGVEVQTKTYDPKAYYAQPDGPAFGGHFSAALYSIANFPKVDPNLILGCDRVPPGGLNLSRFCRADVDAAIARYDGALDAPVQARYLGDVADLVDRYIPFVVLSYTENAFIFDRHLRGFSPNAITYFDEMLDVDR